ncbi:hypothetical protein [Clostridium frigidicarnis]|nr:hypothetical protein [Clostridium frigidicarnis]
MGKPSMFSKDYEKKMKRRRTRNITLSIICLVVIIFGVSFFFLGGSYKYSSDYLTSLFKKDNETQKENIKEEPKEDNKQEKTPIEEPKEQEENSLSMDLDIGNGKLVKANFDETDQGKIFKSIDTNGNKVSFDIDSKGMYSVLLDEDNQNLYLSDTNGTLTDISLDTYNASSGTQFSKENVLRENPTYIWNESPRFLNENTLVYVSQLPWFNKSDKYIWTIDLNNKNHQCLNVQGQKVDFGNLSDKGLEVTIDGALKYVTTDGKVIN